MAFSLHIQLRWRWLLMALAVAACVLWPAQRASGISFNGTGQVIEWGVTPFVGANGEFASGGMTSIRQNNTSPINYPGHGYVPSPGGATGEKFDLEEMHIRQNGSQVQVLLIASSLYQATTGGATLNLGDLLIDSDGDNHFDLGVVTQSGNAGLQAGRLYDITSTTGLQNLPGSYHGTGVATQIGAWAVTGGLPLGLMSIETASFNYGGSEGLTHAYQYTFDLGYMSLLPEDLRFQIAWGCGNDVIGGTFALQQPGPESTTTAAVPEPASLVLAGVAGGLGLAMLRRRRAA